MTVIRQFVSRNPVVLLRSAASGFLDPAAGTLEQPFPSPSYLLALRQGGLRDDLIRMAARAEPPVRGWFDPPLCVFNELPDWLGTTSRPACGEYERLVLIASLLRAGRHVFTPMGNSTAYVESLDQLFGELVSEAVSATQFEQALAQLAALEAAGQTPQVRDDFEQARDASLLSLYTRYVQLLESHGRRDGRDTLVDCAMMIEQDPTGLATRLGGRREIRVLGLADLRRGWRRLLRALAASPALDAIGIYTSSPLDLGPLDSDIQRLDDGHTLADRLFCPELARGSERVNVLSAPDETRELEHVAIRARALADRGVPLHRIAILARQARPSVDLALHALERAGVPATARTRIALPEIPVVRAVLTLVAAAAEGFTRHGLAELAEQPYIGAQLDAEVINWIGYQRPVRGLDEWKRALGALEQELAEHAGRDDDALHASHGKRPPPSLSRVRDARVAFERFAMLARPLTGEQALDDWLAWLEYTLTADPWDMQARIYAVPPGEFPLARADIASWSKLHAILTEWRAAARAWDDSQPLLNAEQFHAALRGMLVGEAAFGTGTQWGVQVLEALAAAYREFDYVFLVGCDAVNLPRRAPRSPILDDGDRGALAAVGLPLEQRARWDARERELFRMLVATAGRRLTLSYSRLDHAAHEVLRSAFVDVVGDACALRETHIGTSRVITPRLPLYRGMDVPTRAHRAARIERVRQTGELSPYNGLIQDPLLRARLARHFGEEYTWSPTQLESYAKCPWAHFSARLLRLEKRDDPTDDLETAVEGTIMHMALQKFYDAACGQFGAPVMLRTSDLAWAMDAMSVALDAALNEADHSPWVGHPSLRSVAQAELLRTLRKYIAFEIAQNEDFYATRKNRYAAVRTGVERHEEPLGIITMNRGGVRFQYRGTADRVERGMDDRCGSESRKFIAAVDYKRSKGSTPGGGKKEAWKDGVVLQVPLYAYALQQKHEGDVAVRVEYRAIRSREIVHSLDLYEVQEDASAATPNDTARAQMDDALDAAVLHVRGARDGCFPAAPAASCGCPPFCHAWDICRVKDGPKRSGWGK